MGKKRERSEYMKMFYASHRNALLKKAKETRLKNHKAESQKDREYYSRNKEIIIARNAAYKKTEKGKEVDRKYNTSTKGIERRNRAIKKYYRSEKGKFAWKVLNQNRRARGGSYIKVEDLVVVLKRSRGVCGICRHRIKDKYHIDHIVPLNKGGKTVTDNLQIAHPRCNLKKGAA